MNKYTCMRCGKVKVTLSKEKELAMKCCDGDKPATHKVGVVKLDKPADKITPPMPPPTPPVKAPVAVKNDKPQQT